MRHLNIEMKQFRQYLRYVQSAHQLEAIVDTFETPSPSKKAANRPPINYVVPKISNYVINIPLIVKSNTFITYIHNANAID